MNIFKKKFSRTSFIFCPFQIVYFPFSAFFTQLLRRNGNRSREAYQITILIFFFFCSGEFPSFSVLFKLCIFHLVPFQLIRKKKLQMTRWIFFILCPFSSCISFIFGYRYFSFSVLVSILHFQSF